MHSRKSIVLYPRLSTFTLTSKTYTTKSNIKQRINKSKPSGYWKDKENIIQFMQEIKEKLNLKTSEDWNLLTNKEIKMYGGSTLLTKHSIYELKCLGYPEGKLQFDPAKKPIKYWEKKENIIEFLQEIKNKLNIKTKEEWNLLTQRKLQKYGGSRLLTKYSMYEIKCLGFPNEKEYFYKNSIKKEKIKPNGYWDNKDNILHFLNQIKEKYNLTNFDDFNKISQKLIIENGGSSLLGKYTLFELKCLIYENGKLKFNSTKPNGYWDNEENILLFLNQIKEKYNLTNANDWDKITSNVIKLNGGGTLFHKYSLFELKSLACPDYFFNLPKPVHYWEKKDNILQLIDQLRVKFKLNSIFDWYRVSRHQIKSLGGTNGFNRKFSLQQIVFENENLKSSSLARSFKRSAQRWLFLQVQSLFPNDEIIEDYFHSEISRESGYSVQFDIFLLHRNIAIEYHGKQHYEDIPSGFSSFELYQSRDKEKNSLCNKYGIQLIVIPYWWDNSLESLRETITLKLQPSPM